MNNRFFVGFSLLEILIALALGAILINLVLYSYFSIKRVSFMQKELVDLSENLRFIDFFLRQNIIHSDFAGCRRITDLDLTNHTAFRDFTAIKGYASNQLPEYLKKKQIVKGTDVIVITKANADVTSLVSDIGVVLTKQIKVKDNPATDANKLLLISDCIHGDLVSAQNVRRRKIPLDQEIKNSYSIINATVGRFEEIAFFVSKTKRFTENKKPIYGLYSVINRGKKEELAAMIKGMRVRYGVVIQNTRSIEYLSAQQVTKHELWSKVVSVVITIIPQNQSLAIKEWQLYIALREEQGI